MFRLNHNHAGIAGRWRMAALVAVSLLAFAFIVPAAGQYQLGDGRALDRNPQAGSGGVNAPRERNPYGRYSDAIITGNVGGLGAFRDRVDYRAPGDFTDVTSLDDTYDFRRVALPQSVRTTPGERPRGAVRNPQIDPAGIQGTVLFRGGAGTRASDLTREMRQFPDSFVIDDSADASGRGIVGDVRLDRRRDDRFGREPAAAGLLADDRGQLLQITTSPLTGVRQRVVGRLRVPREGEMDEDAEDLENLRPEEIEQREEEALEEARRRGRFVDERLTGRQRESGSRRERFGEGQRLEGRVDPVGDALARFDEDEDTERGEDVYVDLLRDINQQTPGRLQLGSRQRSLEEGREPSRIEELAEQFERTQRGEFDDDPLAGEDPEAVADGLSYDLPPVETFVGSADSRINRLLAQAEQYMQEGRYFQAEAVYDRVLVEQPDYAIADIGRVHAQLGAGLYMSAASSLRQTLAMNPQLIAARYGEAVLPDRTRLRAVEDELRRLEESDPDAASLLRSYLAYQQDQTSALETSLEDLDRATGEQDPMADVLRGIWLRNRDREQDSDEQTDPPLDSPDEPVDDARPDSGDTDDPPLNGNSSEDRPAQEK